MVSSRLKPRLTALAFVPVCIHGKRVSMEESTLQPTVKGPCSDYFGDMEGVITVADPDVGHTSASAPYCEANGMSTPCIYMHLAGSANECQSPAPPDGCHRYHTVQYSECDELENFNFAARIDTTGAFAPDGVFIACRDRVISNEVRCYGPPADMPEACECPESEPEVKYPCPNYFGDLDGIVTVADPDVGHTSASAPYCEANGMSTPCIYMHLAGSANECQSPGPPDGCHRYHTVKYSECDELENFNFDARIDTTGAFDNDGVFIACADRVISHEVNCYGPPADMPEACECPEREPEVKYPCPNYFGDLDGIVTVADPDVGHTSASAPYCEANGMSTPCIYMHLAGSANECQSPAPPDSCHRYHTVKYSECDELQNFNFNARIDTTGAFDTDGVFIACADRVISNEVHCFGPPADMPVPCECPTEDPHLRVGGASTKYLLDMLRIKNQGYSEAFCSRSTDECATCDEFPGYNVHSELTWQAVKDGLEQVPALQESGSIVRLNDLGYLILNTAMWDVQDGDVKTLGLGVNIHDHKYFRPMMDNLLGTNSEFWNPEMIADYTREFFQDRQSLNAGRDVSDWSTKFLHKIHLGIDLSDAEAGEFFEFQGLAVVVTSMLQSIVDHPIGRWGLSVHRLQQMRRNWLVKYKDAITRDTRGVFPPASDLSDHQLHLIATGIMDSLVFAGGLSVATITKAGLAVLFSSSSPLEESQRQLTEDTVTPLVFETIRRFPGVLGFPYWESTDIESHRTVLNLGMSLRDPRVWGEDAFEFKLRDLEVYRRHLGTGWAQPANGPGWEQPDFEMQPMSRGCPGQSLSVVMMTEFFNYIQETQAEWAVSAAPSGGIAITECVPFVDPFTISRVIKQGYLLEKAGYFGSWTRRYYQLLAGDGATPSTVRAWSSQSAMGDDPARATASLSLANVLDTKTRTGESYDLDNASCFKLYTTASSTDWRLCVQYSDASSDQIEADRDAWLQAIQLEMPHLVSPA